jgi:hypothetical protein
VIVTLQEKSARKLIAFSIRERVGNPALGMAPGACNRPRYRRRPRSTVDHGEFLRRTVYTE